MPRKRRATRCLMTSPILARRRSDAMDARAHFVHKPSDLALTSRQRDRSRAAFVCRVSIVADRGWPCTVRGELASRLRPMDAPLTSRDAILHARAGIEALQFGDHAARQVRRHLLQLHERSASDQLGYVFSYMCHVSCHLGLNSSLRFPRGPAADPTSDPRRPRFHRKAGPMSPKCRSGGARRATARRTRARSTRFRSG